MFTVQNYILFYITITVYKNLYSKTKKIIYNIHKIVNIFLKLCDPKFINIYLLIKIIFFFTKSTCITLNSTKYFIQQFY